MQEIRLKAGVKLNDFSPQILLAIIIAQQIYISRGYTFTITSLNDSQHSTNSLHYIGHAVDIRTRHVEDGDKQQMVSLMRGALGDEFDVGGVELLLGVGG